MNVAIEDVDCSGATTSSGQGQGADTGSSVLGASIPFSSDDLASGKPGQHAAGGDKLAAHLSGGNLAIQALGSPDAPAPALSVSDAALSIPSSTPTPITPSSVTSSTSIVSPDGKSAPLVSQPELGANLEEDEDECDEL